MISSATGTAITKQHGKIVKALEQTMRALEDEDRAGSERARVMKQDLTETLVAIAPQKRLSEIGETSLWSPGMKKIP